MRRVLAFAALAVALGACGSGNGARDATDPNVVAGDDVDRRALTRVEEMLRGQMAGVDVREQDGQLVIRIRGPQTVLGSSDPLFVIDGLPLTSGPGGGLTGINPNDVASIRVLKNASETALYGARGANGVVLITTVRPPPPDRDGDGS